MPLVKSFPKMLQKSTDLITCLQWRSILRAPSKKWLNNVRLARGFCIDPLLTRGPLFTADSNGMMGSMMQDLAFAIPGVDEAMSFAEIMKSVLSHLLSLWFPAPNWRSSQARQVNGVLCDRL